MEKPLVRCRCGHAVLGREVLRTDLYERSSGREYVYVKFRCARCKRIAQTFVPASSWDWHKLEAAPGELTIEERDRLLEAPSVDAVDLLAFHDDVAALETIAQLSSALRLDELSPAPTSAACESRRPRRRTRGRRERADKRAERKDKKKDRHDGEARNSHQPGDESSH